MQRIPRLDRSKNLLFLRDRTLITRRDNPQGGYVVIKSPPPDDLALVVEAVDGVRTLQDICDHLAATFDADAIVETIEALDGIVLELAPPPTASAALASTRVAIVGAGQLALDLAAALATRARLTLLWLGAEAPADTTGLPTVELIAPSALPGRLAAFPIVIAAHSGGSLGAALDVNQAALAANVICVHVLTDGDAIVVGPSTLPYRTPCLECGQINWYFRSHAAHDAAVGLRRLAVPELADPQLRHTLIAAAARRLEVELTSLVTGAPYPTLLGAFVRLSLAEGTRLVELVPTANCESCHGCNRQGIQLGFDPQAIPELPRLERRPLIADNSGGVRSIELDEARRRAEAAMAQLGIEMSASGYSPKVQRRYPELRDLPFVYMIPRSTFRADAELIIDRAPPPCFGKGAIPEQAMCSGTFEFLERTLIMYRGGVDLVRAPYTAVREHAIDMVAFTEGVLDIPDRGPRINFDPGLEIDWVWARCLRTDRPRLVPARTVLLPNFSDPERPSTSTFRGSQIEMPLRGSSGCAAGATREDAVLQGLYEVIEHDARLLHDRTGIGAPALDLASIDDPLTKRLIQQVQDAGFELHLRYLSRDIKVPVVEAYLTSSRDLTFYRVPGWGAHHDPAIAIRRAVTETVQCIGAVESIQSQTFAGGIYSITNSFHESRYCMDRTHGVIRFEDLPRPDPAWRSSLDYLEAAVQSIATALPDVDLCFFEYPSPGLDGIHVVAVVATRVVNNLTLGHIIQDRVRSARRLTATGDRALEMSDFYLGALKI